MSDREVQQGNDDWFSQIESNHDLKSKRTSEKRDWFLNTFIHTLGIRQINSILRNIDSWAPAIGIDEETLSSLLLEQKDDVRITLGLERSIMLLKNQRPTGTGYKDGWLNLPNRSGRKAKRTPSPDNQGLVDGTDYFGNWGQED